MVEAVSTATIEAVSQIFLECRVDLGETARRRERAARFCESFGGVEEARMLKTFIQQEATEGRESGLMIHYLADGTRTREVLAYMGAKSKHRKVTRHGASPAMDLPDSPEAMARVAGYGDIEEWETNRTQRFMWARWQFERRHLGYDERLEDIASEFGYTPEDTYDILSAACLRQYQDVIERLEGRVEAIRKDMGVAERAVTKATLKSVQDKLDELREEASEVHGLQDWHNKGLERAKTAKGRARQRERKSPSQN